MFNLDQAIAEWRRQMAAAGIKRHEILDELESHLRDDVARQIGSGLSEQQAFKAAVQRIGHTRTLKLEFAKISGIKWAISRKLMRVFGWGEAPFPDLVNFDASAIQSLEFARSEPLRFHHDFIGTEHLLLGLLRMETGIVTNVLDRLGVNAERISREIETIVGLGPVHETLRANMIPYTPRAREALLLAVQEAKTLNHLQVGAEHIFLGLLREGSGVAAVVLKKLGIDVERTRNEILRGRS